MERPAHGGGGPPGRPEERVEGRVLSHHRDRGTTVLEWNGLRLDVRLQEAFSAREKVTWALPSAGVLLMPRDRRPGGSRTTSWRGPSEKTVTLGNRVRVPVVCAWHNEALLTMTVPRHLVESYTLAEGNPLFRCGCRREHPPDAAGRRPSRSRRVNPSSRATAIGLPGISGGSPGRRRPQLPLPSVPGPSTSRPASCLRSRWPLMRQFGAVVGHEEPGDGADARILPLHDLHAVDVASCARSVSDSFADDLADAMIGRRRSGSSRVLSISPPFRNRDSLTRIASFFFP